MLLHYPNTKNLKYLITKPDYCAKATTLARSGAGLCLSDVAHRPVLYIFLLTKPWIYICKRRVELNISNRLLFIFTNLSINNFPVKITRPNNTKTLFRKRKAFWLWDYNGPWVWSCAGFSPCFSVPRNRKLKITKIVKKPLKPVCFMTCC